MESHQISTDTTNSQFEPDPQVILELCEFGFDYEMCYLALQISQNDRNQAVELLCSGGTDIETMRVLAQSARIIKDEGGQYDENQFDKDIKQDVMRDLIKGIISDLMLEEPKQAKQVDQQEEKKQQNSDLIEESKQKKLEFKVKTEQDYHNESKMVFVWRQDKGLKNLPIGVSAKYAAEATLKAFQSGLKTDPESVNEWARKCDDGRYFWPKISLKCKDDKELLEIQKRAEEGGINHYMLRKSMILPYKPQQSVKTDSKDQTNDNSQSQQMADQIQVNDKQKPQKMSKEERKQKRAGNQQQEQLKEEIILLIVGPALNAKLQPVTGNLKLL
eukprot:403348264